jgi:Na+/serine symporter
MTLKNYLFVMSVLTLVCWGIFIFVARSIDPTATNWLGFLLFYAALFVSLSGSASLIGFVVRLFTKRRELVFNLVKASFRQSFLFSLFLILALILKAQRLFSWFNLFLLIVIFVVLEFFLMRSKKI